MGAEYQLSVASPPLVVTIPRIPCPRLACRGVYSPCPYCVCAFALVHILSITSQPNPRALLELPRRSSSHHQTSSSCHRAPIPLHLDSCFEQGNTTSSDQRSLAIDTSLDPPFPRSAKPVRGTAKPPLRNYPRLHHHSRQSTRRRTTCCLQGSITRHLSIHPRNSLSRDSATPPNPSATPLERHDILRTIRPKLTRPT
jgi:hypothetical protein